MRLQTIRRRIDALASQYTHDPAFVLVRLEDGTEKEVTVNTLYEDALSGRFSMSFVKMTRGGNVEDAVKVLETFDFAMLNDPAFGRPTVFCRKDTLEKWERRKAERMKNEQI